MSNLRISELTEKTSIASTDLLPIVDESGTPTTKKIQAGNLFIGKGQSFFVASSSASASQMMMYKFRLPLMLFLQQGGQLFFHKELLI